MPTHPYLHEVLPGAVSVAGLVFCRGLDVAVSVEVLLSGAAIFGD